MRLKGLKGRSGWGFRSLKAFGGSRCRVLPWSMAFVGPVSIAQEPTGKQGSGKRITPELELPFLKALPVP